jgi:hypothetical protein
VLRFHASLGDLSFVSRARCRREDRARALPPGVATWILGRALDSQRDQVARGLGQLLPGVRRERWLDEIEQRLRREELIALREDRRRVVVPVQDAGEELGPEEALDWIAIQLVDEDGTPVADREFEITCPDGSVRRGTLDSAGRARVDGIVAGLCTVRFPRIAQVEA